MLYFFMVTMSPTKAIFKGPSMGISFASLVMPEITQLTISVAAII